MDVAEKTVVISWRDHTGPVFWNGYFFKDVEDAIEEIECCLGKYDDPPETIPAAREVTVRLPNATEILTDWAEQCGTDVDCNGPEIGEVPSKYLTRLDDALREVEKRLPQWFEEDDTLHVSLDGVRWG